MSANRRLILSAISLFGMCFVLSACSSSSATAELDNVSIDVESPEVFSNSPSQGDIDIETDQAFTLTFSELMDHDSLIRAITLVEEPKVSAADSNAVAVNVPIQMAISDVVLSSTDPLSGRPIDIEATEVLVTPASGRLSLDRRFRVIVDESAKDISRNETVDPVTSDAAVGNFIEREFSARYETLPGAWESDPIEHALAIDEDFYIQSVTTRKSGEPSAIWAYANSSGAADGLIAGVFDPVTTSWFGPESTTDAYDAIPPVTNELDQQQVSGAIFQLAIAAGEDGALLILWQQKRLSSDSFGVFYNYFDGTSWLDRSAEVSSPSTLYDARFPKAVSLNNGSFLLSWSQETLTDSEVQYRLLVPGGAELLGSIASVPGSEDPRVTDLKLFSYGDQARAFWLGGDGALGLYSSLFSVSRGFGAITSVSSLVSPSNTALGAVGKFDAAMNTSGDGYVAWSQLEGSRTDLFRAAIQNDGVAATEYIESDNRGDVTSPSVAVSEEGAVQIMWIQDQAVAVDVVDNRIMVASKLKDSGWSARVGAIHSGTLFLPNGLFDSKGNFYAFWDSTVNNVQQSERYDAQLQAWSSTGIVGQRFSAVSASSGVTVLNDGRMLLVQLALSNANYAPFSTLYDLPVVP